MEEIKLNMENLTKEEREQLLKLVEKANKKENKVWKPQNGDTYYSIEDYGCIFCSNAVEAAKGKSRVDESRYAIGNCFKTREEAEFAIERLKVVTELRRFAADHNDPVLQPCWILRYDNVCSFSGVIGMGTYNYGAAIIPAFTSEDIAMKAIDAIGKDRLKKYYFGVEE